jgi:molybdate transport system substrate-binding protein
MKSTKTRTLMAAIGACSVLAVGCGSSSTSSGSGGASKPNLTVSAATSLTAAFEQYAKTFTPANVKLSFGGSDQLATQIRQGVVVDVYAAANTTLPADLNKEGKVGTPTTFASNKLVIVVPKGSNITSIDQLGKSGVTIAICAPSVPCGVYTQKVLKGLPDSERKAIEGNVRSEEPNVSGVVAKVTQKAVDAGFVYQTDVAATNGNTTAIVLPSSLSSTTALGAAVVTGAPQSTVAQEFIAGLLQGAGQQALKAAGFGPPPAK